MCFKQGGKDLDVLLWGGLPDPVLPTFFTFSPTSWLPGVCGLISFECSLKGHPHGSESQNIDNHLSPEESRTSRVPGIPHSMCQLTKLAGCSNRTLL